MSDIIGLSGYAQSGKDTIAGILAGYGYERVAFADTVRDVLYAINPVVSADGSDINWPTIRTVRLQEWVNNVGWDRAKVSCTEVRELLQRLGTDAGRNILGENIWVDAAIRKLVPGRKYVFTDMRFPNEAKAVQEVGGSLWRISRRGSGPVNGHPSETALDHYGFGEWIFNNGSLLDLRRAVERRLA